MEDIEIRPTVKFVRAGAMVVAVVVLAAWSAHWAGQFPVGGAAAVTLLLFWPAWRWVRRRFDLFVLSSDRLRWEVGVFSRSTRTLLLSRIQDVTVNQTLWQRAFDVGEIRIETAGATGRVSLPNVDQPKALMDKILERARVAGP